MCLITLQVNMSMRLKEWAKVLISGTVGRGTFPHQFSFILENPLRRLYLSPKCLAERLYLNANSRVLEVGPGPGYFSVEVARRVPNGHLAMFDLQQEMLVKARRKLEAAGLFSVSHTQGDACYFPFGADEFDVVFLVTVLGEVSDTQLCARGCYRILRTGGLLSITEQRPDPDFCPFEFVRTLAEKQGFQFIQSYGRRWNYTANFRKMRF